MMDLMILVAVFVAILALAYFTYRNIVGLDNRLRKIEDVLKNAEVVAAPVSASGPITHAPTTELSHDVSENSRISGWGGEGPPVNVERVPSDNDDGEEHDVQIMDLPQDDDEYERDVSSGEDDDETEGSDDDDDGDDDDGDDDDGGDGDDENENKREHSKYSSVRVSDLKEALKKAGIPFPNGAKKALLVSIAESNNVELSA